MVEDQPLELSKLQTAWAKFIQVLKDNKNPAWQSFELATLSVKDECSFEAIVTVNLQQKFLEMERNKACEFLQKELNCRKLKFSILLVENNKPTENIDVPLSSKEQYQKIIEQFPLVKELKERLKLDLDY